MVRPVRRVYRLAGAGLAIQVQLHSAYGPYVRGLVRAAEARVGYMGYMTEHFMPLFWHLIYALHHIMHYLVQFYYSKRNIKTITQQLYTKRTK